MDPQVISACGTVMAALAAIAALIVSVVIYRGQAELSLKIHEGQMRLSQRQLLLPLWEYMSTLDRINPQAPITPDVLKVVNTLELVALSVEGGMVDAQVIKRTFREIYMELYDQVAACPAVPGLNKSGSDLLRENPAAMAFHDELRREHMNRGKLESLGPRR